MSLLGRRILRIFTVLIIAGLATATLVRFAPGYDSNEIFLDPRISSRTIEAMRQENADNPFIFYRRFLGAVLKGDLGISRIYGRPVRELLQERANVTLGSMATGLGLAWLVGFLSACVAVFSKRNFPAVLSIAASATLLCFPSALLAIFCLVLQLPTSIAIAAVVFPRVFSHGYEQLRQSRDMPHIVIAHAFGMSRFRVFWRQILPSAIFPVLALAGVTVNLALGASIPIEALSDSPGIGQLVWRAALGRDLPVLVSTTLVITLITMIANLVTDSRSR